MNGTEYPSSHTPNSYKNNFCLCFISCLINISERKKQHHHHHQPSTTTASSFSLWISSVSVKRNNVRIAWISSVWVKSKRTRKEKNGLVKKWSATNKWFTQTHTHSSFATKIYGCRACDSWRPNLALIVCHRSGYSSEWKWAGTTNRITLLYTCELLIS